MKTFARVPVVPGIVYEIFIGNELFEMHPDVAVTWHEAPDGTVERDYFDGTNFSEPLPPSNDVLMTNLRQERNGRLFHTDWTQLSDCTYSTDKKAQYVTYRQALRDLPQTCNNLLNPSWPIEPV